MPIKFWNKTSIFIGLGLVLTSLLIWANEAKADYVLPQTACDHRLPGLTWDGVNSVHVTSNMRLEDGSAAFNYGPGDFVTLSNNRLSFRFSLRFTPVGMQGLVKLMGLNQNCNAIFGLGPGFRNLQETGNEFIYDFSTHRASMNGSNEMASSPMSGIRYLWIEVWDGSNPSNFATYSYLVDIQNIQNPTVVSPEPSGRRPVIIIPGIMGTEMFKGTEKLWPDIGRMLDSVGDRFMDPLAFRENGEPLDYSIETGSVISQELFFNYSESLVENLSSFGYSVGSNMYLFSYDWRKSIEIIANDNLKNYINNKISDTGFDTVDIVAHSQGGLLIKKLLYDNPAYQSKINKIVFIGTPHLGAPKAAKALLYGDSMGVGFSNLGLNPDEVKRITQNMPSVYQLLPSYEYFSHGQQYLASATFFGSFISGYRYLNYQETLGHLRNRGLNSILIDSARDFHNSSFDNYTFENSPITVYNIVGCQEGTIHSVLAGNSNYRIIYGAGDGTVPVISANNLFGVETFYARRTDHGTMMTGEGTRQLIVNLIAGTNLNVNSNIITQDSSRCRYNGRQVSVHSPVDLHIYDEYGNHVGPNASGNIDIEIPGVQYDIIEHQKFAFLPDGGNYTVHLNATDNGTFDFYSATIEDNEIVQTVFYNDIQITESSKVVINLSDEYSMFLDTEGNGTFDTTISPSSVLDSEQSLDLVQPYTNHTLEGVQGEEGYYRSDTVLALSSIDPVIEDQGSSGILKTMYSINSLDFYEYTGSLIFNKEGEYSIRYYAVDRAGNNEEMKAVSFTIDKTAPEFTIKFSPESRRLVFNSTDQVSDNGSFVSATDMAGNQTRVRIEYMGNTAIVSEISYNGFIVNADMARLKFLWEHSNIGLTKLVQFVYSGSYGINAVYEGDVTYITGRNNNGKKTQTEDGLLLIEVTTKKSTLIWSY